MKNICIITPTKPKVSETFIQAHIDKIIGNKFLLYGDFPNLIYNNKKITVFYRKNRLLRRLERLLPHFIYEKFIDPINGSDETAYAAIGNFYIKNKIDVIFTEYGSTGANILPIAKAHNIPLIVHFHGVDAHQNWYVERYGEVYKKMFEYAKNIISVSNVMSRQLISLGALPEKIILNPCAPRDLFFELASDYSSNKFLTIGRFTDKKAPHLTILAFNKVVEVHPEAKLIMIGDGPLLNSCKSLTKALNIREKVEFTGALMPHEIIAIMPQCFCFLQHSITAPDGDSEGTPVAILEAGASGLPVVSTKHAGLMDVVIHGQTGFLVDEKDIDGMSQNMIQLFENRTLCKELGRNAKEHIGHNFNMKKHIQLLQQLIQSC